MRKGTDLDILIVDDRPDDTELMAATLEQVLPGCRVTVAHSAEEAQTKVGDAAWSLILLDYKLPRQNGLELLPKLLRASPTAAVIMMTGHGSEDVAVEAMRRGAAYYLKKSPSLLAELPIVVNEVLEKWRLRQELDLAHSRLHSLINHVNDIVYELDAEGRLTFVSREVEWSLGYNPSELLGLHFTAMMPAEAAKQIGRMVAERRTGSRATRGLEVSLVFNREVGVHLKTRGGEIRLFEVNAAGLYDTQRVFLGTAGIARDITKRKQDEAARREFEARLQTVMELASDAIYMKSLDGRYLLVNPAARHLLARTDQQVLGKTDAELLDPETAKAFMETDRQVLADGRRVERLERERLPNGGVRVWHSIKTPHRSQDGKTIGLFGISRDVTEQVKREEEHCHAEKLKALGQVVAGVAHELNNPLTTILCQAHLLRDREYTDPACRKTADIVITQAERTAKIVQDLLTFARPQLPSRAPVSLNELLECELGGRTAELAARSIVVRRELAQTIPPVPLDEHQMQQVFWNLIKNASDAMWDAHGAGTLTVTTSLVGGADAALSRRPVSLSESGDLGEGARGGWGEEETGARWVEIRISDTGPGIPEPLRGQIFTPFFTTKSVGKGTGLGLAIVYSIVKEHGGTIAVGEAAGGGACFTVRLPLCDIVSGEHAPTVGPVPVPPPPRSARLVVLEDEPMIRDLMAKVMGQAGYEVTVFEKGQEALAYLEREGGAVDLILSDMKMPCMDGEEFYRRLLARDPMLASRMVFCTGDTLEERTSRLIEETGHVMLTKPFTPEKLLTVVQDVLRRLGAGGG